MDDHRPPIDRIVRRVAREWRHKPAPWPAAILVALFLGLTYFFTFTPAGIAVSLWIGE